MSEPVGVFVERVRARLGWRAAATAAGRAGAWGAVPAATVAGLGLLGGVSLVPAMAATALGAVALVAGGLAWHRRPASSAAATTADRALGLDGLLASCTAAHALPGFAAALRARGAAAVAAARVAPIARWGRDTVRPVLSGTAALVAVGALTLIPPAGASERARDSARRAARGAALLEAAQRAAAQGASPLATALADAGRAVLDTEPGDGASALDAVARAEQHVRDAERRAAAAGEALAGITAAEQAGAVDDADAALARAEAVAPTPGARAALARAREASAGSEERRAALDAAVANLAPLADPQSGLERAALAAHLRQARAGLADGAEDAGPAGSGTGSGRTPPSTPEGPRATDAAAALRAVAPRVFARPTWAPEDDAIVRRYFGADLIEEAR